MKSIHPISALESNSTASNPTLWCSPTLPASVIAAHHNAPPLKLGVMASGSGSNFEAIAQAITQKTLNARIQVVIYNNPHALVAKRAEQRGIPAVLLNHREFESREALDRAIVLTLQRYQVDWVIMAGWMRCVTQLLLDAFPNQVLNIHPSLLPSFPGLHAVKQALDSGVTLTGCTVHHVVLAVDSGPIVMQAAVPVLPTDTVETLHDRIHTQEHTIYPLAIILSATPGA